MRFTAPDDGLPCTDDWVGCFESMLFGGVDLQREPLDVSMQPETGLGFLKKRLTQKVTNPIFSK